MIFESRFFSENRPKYPFRGKGLLFGGHDENGQNEAETDGFGNRDAKIFAGQGIARTGEETMKDYRSGRSSCQDTAKKRISF